MTLDEIERLASLRNLALDGKAIHRPEDPEYRVCDGLLTALERIAALEGLLREAKPYTVGPVHARIAAAIREG